MKRTKYEKELTLKRIILRHHPHFGNATITKVTTKMTDDDYGMAGEHFECTLKSTSGQSFVCLVSKTAYKRELEKEVEVIFI